MIHSPASISSLGAESLIRLYDARGRGTRDQRLKRSVRIRIASYVGLVQSATHYTPSLEIEENPVWGEAEQDWILFNDDQEGQSIYTNGPALKSEIAARDWVRKTLRRDFPKTTFRYRYETRVHLPRWLLRQGD